MCLNCFLKVCIYTKNLLIGADHPPTVQNWKYFVDSNNVIYNTYNNLYTDRI